DAQGHCPACNPGRVRRACRSRRCRVSAFSQLHPPGRGTRHPGLHPRSSELSTAVARPDLADRLAPTSSAMTGKSPSGDVRQAIDLHLSEGEAESFGTAAEELDLKPPVADRFGLTHQLIHPLLHNSALTTCGTLT